MRGYRGQDSVPFFGKRSHPVNAKSQPDSQLGLGMGSRLGKTSAIEQSEKGKLAQSFPLSLTSFLLFFQFPLLSFAHSFMHVHSTTSPKEHHHHPNTTGNITAWVSSTLSA